MYYLKKCLCRLYKNYFCPYYMGIQKYFYGNDILEENRSNYRLQHIYDLLADIIKLQYYIKGKKYTLCIPRENAENVFQTYIDIIQRHNNPKQISYHNIMDSTLNEKIDLTDRVNEYLGIKGSHLKYGNIKIKWLLTLEELMNFKELVIVTNDCEEIKYTDVNDNILLKLSKKY